ncbi:hypothetical protein GM50_1560 [freshwater metagenome]|uniref:Uncharacterized protein n=1 Tax=freshwater metagenome TaxID=449393 RepID=A0A094Q850_9ZZZZ
MAKVKTIYSVYKEDASRRKLENVLPEFYPSPLFAKRFQREYLPFLILTQFGQST